MPKAHTEKQKKAETKRKKRQETIKKVAQKTPSTLKGVGKALLKATPIIGMGMTVGKTIKKEYGRLTKKKKSGNKNKKN